MDNGDAHPMNIDDESDDSVEEIGKPTQSEGVASTSRPKKRKRKLISKVWDYFVLIEQDPEKPDQPLVCKCKKCNKLYSAESYSGTGNLKRHLKGCLKSTTRDIGQYMISSSRGVIGARNSNFNHLKRLKDFMTRMMLLRCDSTGDLYPVRKPSPLPHAFLISQHTWHQRLGHPGSEVLCCLISRNFILCNKEKPLVLWHASRAASIG
ncbi:ribonuclease H-like domain-containing protein [Tanacetum coccineum]